MAEATIDAFGHVNVVSCCPSASVFSLFCFDRDGRCRADCFTQLACNAALFARWVSSQGMLATETRGDWSFFEGVVDCITSCAKYQSLALGSVASFKWVDIDSRRSEVLFQHNVHAPEDLSEQEVVASFIYRAFSLVKPFRTRQSKACRRWTRRCRIAGA